jgi:hypothetical protein
MLAGAEAEMLHYSYAITQMFAYGDSTLVTVWLWRLREI